MALLGSDMQSIRKACKAEVDIDKGTLLLGEKTELDIDVGCQIEVDIDDGIPHHEEAMSSASSSVGEQEPVVEDYSDKSMLFSVIRQKHAKLVTPDLFKQFNKDKEPLPKCQEVARKFFLDVNALTQQQWESLEVIAISQCWIDPEHPDPQCYYLDFLSCLLHLFTAGRCEATAAEDFRKYIDDENVPCYRFHEQVLPSGSGDGRPVGIFCDWTSLPQDRPKGSRTVEETAVFDCALENVSIWYAHDHTITWMLSFLPPTATRASVSVSGWPTFERSLSGLISPQSKLLDIDGSVRDRLLSGSWNDYTEFSLDVMDLSRGAPKTPETFNAIIEACTFTSDTDKDNIVIPTYRRTFDAAMANAKLLQFVGSDLDDKQAAELIEVVRTHCKDGQLKKLVLAGNAAITLPLEEWTSLARGFAGFEVLDLTLTGVCGNISCVGQLQNLTKLIVERTKVCGDIACLANLKELKDVSLSNTHVFGDIACLANSRDLTKISLSDTQVFGDIAWLANLRDLAHVSLSFTHVSGDIACFANSMSLTELFFAETKVIGDISSLAELQNLTTVFIREKLAWDIASFPELRTGVSGNISSSADLQTWTELYALRTKVFGDIACFADLAHLKVLSLYKTWVFGEIECLTNLFSLTELTLWGTQVSGDIGCLSGLRDLRIANLCGTQVIGDIGELQNCTRLEGLNFGGCANVLGDIACIAHLRDLVELSFSKTQVWGDIACLANLTDLTELGLSTTHVFGDIGVFAACMELVALDLRSTKITGDIAALQACRQLEGLDLRSCAKVTGDLDALKRSCPKLEGIWVGSNQSCCSQM